MAGKYLVKFPSEAYARNISSGFLFSDESYLNQLICDCIIDINPDKLENMSFREKKHLGIRIKSAAEKKIIGARARETRTRIAKNMKSSEQLNFFG